MKTFCVSCRLPGSKLMIFEKNYILTNMLFISFPEARIDSLTEMIEAIMFLANGTCIMIGI